MFVEKSQLKTNENKMTIVLTFLFPAAHTVSLSQLRAKSNCKRILPEIFTHRRVLGAGTQPTQDISLITEGPDGDLLHLALGQTWHQRDVTQGDGWDLLPRTSQCDLTLPVCRSCDHFDAVKKCDLQT